MLRRARFFRLILLALSLVFSVLACRRSEPEPSPQVEASGVAAKETPTPKRPPEHIELKLAGASIDDEAGGLAHLSLGDPPSARGIVILFHGYGADGDDLMGVARRIQAGLRDEQVAYLTVEAPFALRRGRAWFRRDRSNFDEGLGYAKAFVRWVRAKYPEARLVLGGFSQGAMITANLLAEADDHFAAAIVFSPADLLPHEPTEETPRVPVFLSHGTRDKILPFAGAVQLRDRLRGFDYDVSWHQFEGRHQIHRSLMNPVVEHVRAALSVSAK